MRTGRQKQGLLLSCARRSVTLTSTAVDTASSAAVAEAVAHAVAEAAAAVVVAAALAASAAAACFCCCSRCSSTHNRDPLPSSCHRTCCGSRQKCLGRHCSRPLRQRRAAERHARNRQQRPNAVGQQYCDRQLCVVQNGGRRRRAEPRRGRDVSVCAAEHTSRRMWGGEVTTRVLRRQLSMAHWSNEQPSQQAGKEALTLLPSQRNGIELN